MAQVYEQILAPCGSETLLDRQVAQAQQAVRSGPNPAAALERLGWCYVAKARATFDEHYYTLAEDTSRCLESRHPDEASVAGARLLRGHVWHNQHRFAEAEGIARDLVARRHTPFDHGLLGDVLMEMGRLDEAAVEYQAMMDLRPDSRALTRAAHLRWLRGDLAGAILAMTEAMGAAGERDAEAAAWMRTRLAFYELASNNPTAAEQSCVAALQWQTNYAPALFLLGRVHLAAGDGAEAIEPLQRAARILPLPEHEWALSEALFESGRFEESRAVEARLRQSGLARDARSFALFLATRREQAPFAVALMQDELKRRADVFTHDALAWCLAAAGQFEEAWDHMEKALSAGTSDGRLFVHAAVIAARTGRTTEARRFHQRAAESAQSLLPSEKRQLDQVERTSLQPNQIKPNQIDQHLNERK
jgi:tetratricopeptide (TPR) repeat protein